MTANQMTIVGNLTGDPELRYIQSGAAVCNLTVVDTPRIFDRETNSYKDDDASTLFLRCTMWRDMAQNVEATLKKGMEVIVVGRLVSRSWETNGEKRTVNELRVEHIGPSLRWLQGEMRKVTSGNSNQNQPPQQGTTSRPAQNQGGTSRPAQTAPPASDEPPF